jgi:hypothetical protein
MQETKSLVFNLKNRLAGIVNKILTYSTIEITPDNHIRMLAAEAKGIRDTINYITDNAKSIIIQRGE